MSGSCASDLGAWGPLGLTWLGSLGFNTLRVQLTSLLKLLFGVTTVGSYIKNGSAAAGATMELLGGFRVEKGGFRV